MNALKKPTNLYPTKGLKDLKIHDYFMHSNQLINKHGLFVTAP